MGKTHEEHEGVEEHEDAEVLHYPKPGRTRFEEMPPAAWTTRALPTNRGGEPRFAEMPVQAPKGEGGWVKINPRTTFESPRPPLKPKWQRERRGQAKRVHTQHMDL